MQEYLKQYEVTLQTVGPVFIGNDKEIKKKEYIFLGKNKVGIFDIPKLYQELKRRGKSQKFEEYLMGNRREDLTTWLFHERIQIKDVKPFLKYTLDCEETAVENKKQLQIMEMIKDPYGNPYIPGSSLKGMLRTILLCYDLKNNQDKYAVKKDELTDEIFKNTYSRQNRNNFLKDQSKGFEEKAFHILKRDEEHINNAVNDKLSGLIVSDSQPLDVNDLTLCQKVEIYPDGTEKIIPILRECIKPGKIIRFNITIDTTVCKLTDQDIKDAVKDFITIYQIYFGGKFIGNSRYRVNQVILGGGSGFVSKTLIYSLYRKEGVKVCQTIYKKMGVNKQHGHAADLKLGVSPHILKCTKYKGELYQMGLCNFIMRGKN